MKSNTGRKRNASAKLTKAAPRHQSKVKAERPAERPKEFYLPYFDQVQYRTDRGLHWIKLEHGLLSEPSAIWFQDMPDAHKFHFIGLLLLARQFGNRLPYDARFLARRMSATEPINLDWFLENGLIAPLEERQIQLLQQRVTAESRQSDGRVAAESRQSDGKVTTESRQIDATMRIENREERINNSLSLPTLSLSLGGERERKSAFDLETRLAFAEWQKRSGEPIKSPLAVARTSYADGSMDAHIQQWQADQAREAVEQAEREKERAKQEVADRERNEQELREYAQSAIANWRETGELMHAFQVDLVRQLGLLPDDYPADQKGTSNEAQTRAINAH